MPRTINQPLSLAIGAVVVGVATLPAKAQWCTDTLAQAHTGHAATSVGGKALFAGGWDTGGHSSRVEVFDAPTSTWAVATLSESRYDLTATSIGGKALFAGGIAVASCSQSDRVDIYDSVGGVWSSGPFLSQARYELAATSVGNVAMFAGGWRMIGCNGTVTNRVDIYDVGSGTWSTAALTIARGSLAATTVGSKAMFAGGSASGGDVDRVDIYDLATNNWSIAALSQGRHVLVATTVGNKALFAGGAAGSVFSDVVDIYDDTTNTWSVAHLSQPRAWLAATTVGNFAVFAGGLASTGSGNEYSDVVDIYDDSLGTWSTWRLSQGRWQLASTSVGGLAMFGGGSRISGGTDRIDVFGCSPAVFSPFCSGDGIDPGVTTSCPCSNFGSPGHGCASSSNPNGALLQATGTTNPDSVELHGSGMPSTSLCIYLQGDALDDALFGDGVRCVGGSLIRLRTKSNVGGASQFPEPGEPSVSARGHVTLGSGARRYYQTYYRNPAASFCPSATFNVTSGVIVNWL